MSGTGRGAELPGPRSALIIATSEYADGSLARLRSPARDGRELAGVLGDPGIGGFDVTTLSDPTAQELRICLADFLAGRKPAELLLVYLSCHGVLDRRNRLYFAATDTRKDLLAATGVESGWLLEQLDDCRARSQILILDCCFSGAFARGAKGAGGDGGLDLGRRLDSPGRGRVVLTASRAHEYSFEGEPLPDAGVPKPSVFTAGLVHGLRTGEADRDGDGLISVEDAYEHAYAHVQAHGSGQTPQRWLFGAEGRIWLARSPRRPVPAAAAGGKGAGEAPQEDAGSFLKRAIAHVEAQRYAEALADLNRSLSLRPDHAPALALRAEVWKVRGENERALADLDRALALDASLGYACASRGHLRLVARHPDAALADLDRAIELDPGYAWAHALRGDARLMRGEHELALADLDRAVALDPGSDYAHALRGEVYRVTGRYREAVGAFTHALGLNPRNDWALARRAMVHVAMAQPDAARADVQAALSLNPDNDYALACRGDLSLGRGENQAALADLDRAVSLNPHNDYAHALRGEVYRVTGDYRMAIDAFRHALDLNPRYDWVLARRGDALLTLGDTAAAQADLHRALELNPRNEAALTSRGDLYRSLGQIEPALVDLNTALSISPGCVRALAVRAATLRLAGDVKGAAADLEQALRLDRHHTRARLEVMRLPARYRKRLWRLGAS
ncbi:tetratricopeptide repeat protein [Streptomyces sp. 7-21]|uniref:caspase, EACC1-associated type n=1 Tax=Streptomyces sp. 7-21 TaxID=2802283 RepID=UPI00191DDB97|nr:tetratricopeptide repeat protein [Streptomyces sp. 7-21]MBL1065914.1 tetratricopeptide repeat protein [Streptomyces sp. 7-21]